MPEIVERQTLAVEAVAAGGPLEDGSGIVIELRLAGGQMLALQLPREVADTCQLTLIRASAEASTARRQRGIDAPNAAALAGAPIATTGFQLLGSADGGMLLMVAQATADRVPPIAIEAHGIPALVKGLQAADSALSAIRRRTAH